MTSDNLIVTDNNSVISTGSFKIWKQDKDSGRSQLVVDKPNTILYSGANIIAMALAGISNAKITHIYLGYSNNPSNPVAAEYTVAKNSTTFTPGGDLGYLRVPLTFPASFNKSGNEYTFSTTGNGNIAVFTVLIKNASGYVIPSSASLTSGTSQFYEAGLISSLHDIQASDVPVARVAFARLTYDNTFNLTISWGIKISLS